MSRLTLQSVATLALATALIAPVAAAQDPAPPAPTQVESEQQLFTVEELDNLLARVALYPDPILAQLLVAATFPDQVALAARYVRTYGQRGIDDQAWDVSVKSIAHYPPVLNLLDEDPDWATAVGQAYAIQEGDVMAAVQGLRKMAHAQGNLITTAEQKVEVEPEHIRIIPAQPKVIYVPVYDPAVVYYRPVHYVRGPSAYWSFGIGFPIGAWLTYDFDWGHRVVYYHGWNGYGRHYTWYHASRPFIYINSVYVNPWRTVVVINRRVVHRYVDYGRFDRHNWVHRRVSWDRRSLPGRYDGDRWGTGDNRGGGYYAPRPTVNRTVNRTVTRTENRNVNRTAQPRDVGTRVYPTRVGGSTRQAAPSPSEPTRTAPSRDNGTWNARPAPERRTAAPTRPATVSRSEASPTRSATPSRPSAAPTRTATPAQPRATPSRPSATPSRSSATPSRSAAPSRPSTTRSSGSSSSSSSENRGARKRGD